MIISTFSSLSIKISFKHKEAGSILSFLQIVFNIWDLKDSFSSINDDRKPKILNCLHDENKSKILNNSTILILK